MAQRCSVCTNPNRQAIETAICTGITDEAVARQFGIQRVSVGRHRRNHIIRAAHDRLAILTRDAPLREERQLLAAAASADEAPIDEVVKASLGTRALLKKLNNIENRLERVADLAEQAGSPTGVAVLAGQQIRSLEFGAKLGGHPNFRPPTAIPQHSDRPVVSIEMVFKNSGTRETIDLIGKVVDGDKFDPGAAEGELPSPHPKQKLQGDINGYWSFDSPRSRAAKDDAAKDDAGEG
jgi:hypothetical protein